MELIGQGQQAHLYLDENKVVHWIADGCEANANTHIGWELCRDCLVPPHFPRVYCVWCMPGRPLEVLMEYIAPLAKPTVWRQEQADTILAGLQKAGVWHRDVHRSLFQRPSGEWVLMDFGWACEYAKPYDGPWYLGGNVGTDDAHAFEVVKQELGG